MNGIFLKKFLILLIGLLESDTQRIIMGNRDWAQYIAEDLGYYVDFVSWLCTRL